MKKNIFNIVIIIVIFIISSLSVNADEKINIIGLSYKIENAEAIITRSCTFGDLMIPNYIEGYPTTKIEKEAFCLNSMLTSIILPNTLVTIEDEAILSCKNIKEITIPKSVQNIGNHALGYMYKIYYDEYDEFGNVKKDLEKMSGFTIKGYKGTAAETYAKENGFKFVYLDDEPQVTTATTMTTQTTTTSTTVSTITTSKATTETTKATTSTPITSATTFTTNSTTIISTSSSTSGSTTLSTTSTSIDTTTNLTTPLTTTSTSVTTSETTSITTTHVKGDANGDNKLDVRDAAFIAQKIALDKAVELPKCADFNEDGTVNVRDAAAIARYFASRKR